MMEDDFKTTTSASGVGIIGGNPVETEAGIVSPNAAPPQVSTAGTLSAFSTSGATENYQRLGDACFNRLEKVNGELFVLTYGALVAQLVKDYETVQEVNEQLDRMGYNMGVRLIDEFLAKSNIQRCGDFRETAQVVAKVGFRMFLGVSPEVSKWNSAGTSCSLIFQENQNPLESFVELPSTCEGLSYSNILRGIIRGALESVSMRVDVRFVGDALRGDERTEIRLELKEIIEEAAGEDYRED